MDKPLHILISAYACGPNWGSEIGMGWNWVISISNYCKITVITELGFKKDIEETLPNSNVKYMPDFHYIDIGEQGRKLFWKQGSFNFYSYYNKWQKMAFILAKELINKKQYDIVHQLNMIGYREPGYLWKIKNIPYIIGPVGGYDQFPKKYYGILNFRSKLFYLARSIINFIQMHILLRPKKAYKKAKYVILATSSGEKIVSKYSNKKPIIIAETGAHKTPINQINKDINDKLVITWVGIINGRKALPIAIKAIAKSKYCNKIVFNIVGYGPEMKDAVLLSKKIGLNNVTWHGKLPNSETKKIIGKSDLFFFTSVLEATSTVIFEALQSNTPVLCHDICGFGNVIDKTCGVKIPVINISKSIDLFSEKIDDLFENPNKLQSIKDGCQERLNDYYWDEKGKKILNIYTKCLA